MDPKFLRNQARTRLRVCIAALAAALRAALARERSP
jgi:hypothetical protein